MPSTPIMAGGKPRKRFADLIWSIAFVGPNISLFTIFIIVPVISALLLSLFEWNLVAPPRFVGLANFVAIAQDARALNSILRTVFLIIGGVLPTVLLGFLLAVLIDTKFRGIRLFRSLYLMPIVISFVASAILWSWIFDPRSGPVNQMLSALGIIGPDWLSSTGWSLPAVTIVMIWLRLPVAILLYLAAIQGVNPSLLEAARIDGANTIARMRHIIWPAVAPVTLFVLITTLRGVLFDSFDVVKVMTNGGPIGSTDILIKYIYDAAFQELRLGYASALSAVLFLIVLLLALFVFPMSRKKA